jgi:hypothetical protein
VERIYRVGGRGGAGDGNQHGNLDDGPDLPGTGRDGDARGEAGGVSHCGAAERGHGQTDARACEQGGGQKAVQ